jgi:hypothetical protein
MSKRIEVKLNQPAEQLIARAQAGAEKNGVAFAGDASTGNFSGKGIEGSYLIEGEMLKIDISKKPMVMPWALIETSVKKFFA